MVGDVGGLKNVRKKYVKYDNASKKFRKKLNHEI